MSHSDRKAAGQVAFLAVLVVVLLALLCAMGPEGIEDVRRFLAPRYVLVTP